MVCFDVSSPLINIPIDKTFNIIFNKKYVKIIRICIIFPSTSSQQMRIVLLNYSLAPSKRGTGIFAKNA